MLFDPRPIQRPSSQLLEDLIATRATFRVRGSWTTGDWYAPNGSVASYCTLGAVQKTTFGNMELEEYLCEDRLQNMWPEQKDRFTNIVNAIYDAVPSEHKLPYEEKEKQELRIHTKQIVIADFNDAGTTPKHRRKVMRVLERAIRNEERRLAHTVELTHAL